MADRRRNSAESLTSVHLPRLGCASKQYRARQARTESRLTRAVERPTPLSDGILGAEAGAGRAPGAAPALLRLIPLWAALAPGRAGGAVRGPAGVAGSPVSQPAPLAPAGHRSHGDDPAVGAPRDRTPPSWSERWRRPVAPLAADCSTSRTASPAPPTCVTRALPRQPSRGAAVRRCRRRAAATIFNISRQRHT